MSHNNIKDWVLLDKNYLSLEPRTKIQFFNNINSTNINRIKLWINLSNNLNRQYLDNNVPNYDNKLVELLNAFKNLYINLIFEELVTTGILNKFVLNSKITDKLLLPQDFGPRKDRMKSLIKESFESNKKDWTNSYYYLTNNKFKNLQKMRLENKKGTILDKYEELSYFDIISKDHEWPVFYAMDWISQISFFQHYIYHQVLYVTGATGQGKSTQVPKLLLYALKAIDYKSNGKVICTQPRVTPTVNNATRISDELGLPIEQISNVSSVKIKTNNFYVQYKHQADSHANSKQNYGTLQLVTDGTLLEQIKQNPTMKQKSPEGKFVKNNMYDIIIVDEAHEHNINMDIIIALARQSCYFNNQLKLIIVSATMDDDEPIYRRYFYDINDKIMFPLKMSILHPFLQTEFFPNPDYMDRRYHISPPGETTQYKVDEYYLDFDPSEHITNEREAAKQAQDLGYKKIIDICTKSVSGDILFFANGLPEIKKAVQYLNNNLPVGIVALPYFAKMHINYKDIIEKINIKISSIKTKRENVYLEWGDTFIEDPTVPNGLYKRAVIIATNVAEASITITSLGFVVDNGYAKVNNYDELTNKTSLDVDKISESSRLQRKGRVGRVGNGSVYYMYKKFGRRFIKPKYKITQEELSTTILGILAPKSFDDCNNGIIDMANVNKLIFSPILNFNIFSTIQNKDKINKNNYLFKSGFFELYQENYFINNKSPDGLYYNIIKAGNNEDQTMDSSFFVFENGQIIQNIFDETGYFYLIHPFENSIKRNILNSIIKFENKETYKIPKYKYRYIIHNLFSNNLLVNFKANNTYTNLFEDLKSFVKTELATKIESFSKLQMNISDSITYIAAGAMECLPQVFELKILLSIISNSLDGIINENITWEQFKNIYQDPEIKSDIIFLYNVINKIKYRFSSLLVFNFDANNVKILLDQNYVKIYEEFKKLSEKYIEPPSDLFDGELWNKLMALKNNGKLEKEHKKVLSNDKLTYQIFIKDIDKKSNDIIDWANKNYLNSKVILDFIKQLVEYYLNKNIFNADDNETLKWCAKIKSNFNKYLTTATIEEKIIRSFLYATPNQFTMYTSRNESTKLISYINFKLFNIFFKKSRKQTELTLTNLSNELTFFWIIKKKVLSPKMLKKKKKMN